MRAFTAFASFILREFPSKALFSTFFFSFLLFTCNYCPTLARSPTSPSMPSLVLFIICMVTPYRVQVMKTRARNKEYQKGRNTSHRGRPKFDNRSRLNPVKPFLLWTTILLLIPIVVITILNYKMLKIVQKQRKRMASETVVNPELERSEQIQPEQAELEQAELEQAELEHAELEQAELEQTEFEQTQQNHNVA